jgi:hypothetical protein
MSSLMLLVLLIVWYCAVQPLEILWHSVWTFCYSIYRCGWPFLFKITLIRSSCNVYRSQSRHLWLKTPCRACFLFHLSIKWINIIIVLWLDHQLYIALKLQYLKPPCQFRFKKFLKNLKKNLKYFKNWI